MAPTFAALFVIASAKVGKIFLSANFFTEKFFFFTIFAAVSTKYLNL